MEETLGLWKCNSMVGWRSLSVYFLTFHGEHVFEDVPSRDSSFTNNAKDRLDPLISVVS